jgi:hypothetical protein
MTTDLTPAEREQLRVLRDVHDNPTHGGVWRSGECERLIDLGLAERKHGAGVVYVVITPAGLEEAGRV